MFYAVLIFLLIADALFLELSKNTLPGWIVSAVLFVWLFFTRFLAQKKGEWNSRRAALVWIVFLVLLAVNYRLSAPPVKRVPVSQARHPSFTQTIRIAQGELRGVYNEDRTARTYAGIPYAAPPVGDLRWREPEPAAGWDGIRDCDTFAPMAMQPQSAVWYESLSRILGYHDYRITLRDNFREEMSEDCLYLNVCCPGKETREPLPVLFYIHGGSLTTGRSYEDKIRGENLASRGIIVVTAGYRLGVFGYLASEELEAESPNGTTGDYGLLDQIMALKWVRENIAAFGGDPEQITIAGESAGASCVNALCVSPLTEGMFVRAIAHSSGIVAKKPYHTYRSREEALETGRAVMEEMGVTDIAGLRSVDAARLVRTKQSNSAMMQDGYAIAEPPRDTYERGANHEQALLNGFNVKEADFFMLDTKATADNYVSLLEPAYGKYAEEAAALIPPGSEIQDEKIIIDKGGPAKGSLNRLYSAAWFTYSHFVWSRLVSGEGRPVYEYQFTKRNRSISDFHAGELVYVFGNLWRYPGIYDASDEQLSETMQQMWVNFVKTGDPNGEGLPVWETCGTEADRLMEFGVPTGMRDDPNREIHLLIDRYQEEQGS